ncbi:putative phage abortive infection protein [Aeromonas salmonicida]|uniref:putative phage abortive infection protein n=1 Tax=Aeromonas salmonicida TaxID=645 RepID=UPI000B3F96F5|nr:putative phage abortive infection protein [Aeromonas salmonicida]ARW81567.1 lysogenic conversion protein AbiC [Aeromonas salmonicida]
MKIIKKTLYMKIIKIIFLLLILFCIPVIWFYYPTLIGQQKNFIGIGSVKPNEFGDLYGALNTLFSGLAFFGIVVSIFMQSEELNDTRREIKSQTEQFSSQTQVMFKQSFENTFFQLLGLNNEIVKSADINIKHKSSLFHNVNFSGTGRDAFKELSSYFSAYREKYYYLPCEDAYETFHDEINDFLGHYFRAIYQSLKLIDGAPLDHIQKKEYANMLRAQMSKYELELLFYNCISRLGAVKFRPLLEKYEFFEHLSSSININGGLLLKYDISVFGFTNRKYFERYITQLIKLGLQNSNKVFGYFVSEHDKYSIERREIGMMVSPGTNEVNVDYTVNAMKIKIQNRSLIWVEVLSV